jgi:hypothetical protein
LAPRGLGELCAAGGYRVRRKRRPRLDPGHEPGGELRVAEGERGANDLG